MYTSFYRRFQSFQSLFRSLFSLVSIAVWIYFNRLQNTGAKLFCIWNFLSAAFFGIRELPSRVFNSLSHPVYLVNYLPRWFFLFQFPNWDPGHHLQPSTQIQTYHYKRQNTTTITRQPFGHSHQPRIQVQNNKWSSSTSYYIKTKYWTIQLIPHIYCTIQSQHILDKYYTKTLAHNCKSWFLTKISKYDHTSKWLSSTTANPWKRTWPTQEIFKTINQVYVSHQKTYYYNKNNIHLSQLRFTSAHQLNYHTNYGRFIYSGHVHRIRHGKIATQFDRLKAWATTTDNTLYIQEFVEYVEDTWINNNVWPSSCWSVYKEAVTAHQ